MHIRGCDLLSIRDQLGHRSLETTLTYVQTSPKIHRFKYERYCPIYQESQRPRQAERFIRGEFTFGADPLNNEASHQPSRAGAVGMTLADMIDDIAQVAPSRRERILIGGKKDADEKEGECRTINIIDAEEDRIIPVEIVDKKRDKRAGASKGRRNVSQKKRSSNKRKKRNNPIKDEWKLLLGYAKENGNLITNKDYRDLKEVTRQWATRQMSLMCEMNLLEKEGTRGRSVRYRITAKGAAALI